MDLDVRAVTADDFDAFFTVESVAFSETPSPEDRAQSEATGEWDRSLGAFDGDLLCGTTGAYGFEVTVPGGGQVPTAGVTAVAVLPTHRRRGVLRELMARQLDDVAARGESVALLTASEATIYGRFGYGVASEVRRVEIDRDRDRFREESASRLPLRMLTRDEATERAPGWFDAYRRSRVGELDRPASWWPFVFAEKQTWKGGGPIFVVACEPGDGRPGGYACYTVDRDRTVGPSALVVREVVAADAEVRGALWRHLLDVDLVGRIEASIAVDDELRHRLVDWRALRVTETVDFLWARVLDPVAAFGARRYPVTDSLVVEIDDPFRPATAGRYRIDGGPDGAEVTRVTSEPDLSLGIDTLGSLYLGGVGVEPLARAGRVVGRTPEVVGRADRFFAAGGPGPFCSTSF